MEAAPPETTTHSLKQDGCRVTPAQTAHRISCNAPIIVHTIMFKPEICHDIMSGSLLHYSTWILRLRSNNSFALLNCYHVCSCTHDIQIKEDNRTQKEPVLRPCTEKILTPLVLNHQEYRMGNSLKTFSCLLIPKCSQKY